jgi:hypothetical protein
MSSQRQFRLELPGPWADAWLYKEHLILWDRGNQPLMTPLSGLAQQIEKIHGGAARSLAELSLFRNDWKRSGAVQALRRLDGVDALCRTSIKQEQESLVIQPDRLSWFAVGEEPSDGALLDTTVYGNRVFSACTSGLYETRLNPAHRHWQSPLVQIFDRRTSSVSAKYAAINASAGEDGLWYRSIQWQVDDDMQVDELELVSEGVSRRNSYSSHGLLNYTDDAAPKYLRGIGDNEVPHARANFRNWQLHAYEQPYDLKTGLEAALLGVHGLAYAQGDATAEVLGNSDRNLLVDYAGLLCFLDLRAYDGRALEIRPDPKRKEALAGIPSADILGTYPFAGAFLVELYDEILLIDGEGSHPFYRGQAARVRTYKDSLRYKEVVALVHEDGVTLIGTFE